MIVVEGNRCKAENAWRSGSTRNPTLPVPDAATHPGPSATWCSRRLFRLLVGIDDVAGLQVGRGQYRLGVHALELVDGVALDAVILDLQHARLRPLATLAELDVAHDGLDRIAAQIVGDLIVIDALRTGD